jgi:nitroreductase
MNSPADSFNQIVNERRSVRIFDAEAEFDNQAVQRSIERAILSPNSSNMQLWEFYRVSTKENLKKMTPLCMGQNAARTARELVVIVARKDLWRQRQKANLTEMKKVYEGRTDKQAYRALRYYGTLMPRYYYNDPFGVWGLLKKSFYFFYGLRRPFIRHGNATDIRISVHKSAALAAQTFMLSMKAEGYDTCPMEGIDSLRVKKLLKLPRKAEIVMVIGCGPGSEKGVYSDRFRIPNDDVIFVV